MHVLIAGCTGEIGKQLLPILNEQTNIQHVTALVRRELDFGFQKVAPVKVDFDKLNETQLSKVDVAVCCLGSTMAKAGSKSAFERVDLDYVVAFANLAKQAGASQFHVISASGADKTSLFFYNRVKGIMEEEIRKMSFDTICIYRPSLLDSERSEKRKGERFAVLLFRLINPLFIGPFKRYKSIKTSRIASGVLSRVINPPNGIHVIESETI